MTDEERTLLINTATVARGCALVLQKMTYRDRDMDASQQFERMVEIMTMVLEPFRADAPQAPETEK